MGTSFAVKIRALSQYRKISQENLAKHLGITQSAVSLLLRSKHVKLSQAFALAKMFGVSLDYLADPTIPVRSEDDLRMDAMIHDAIARLGPERAYNRLIMVERAEVAQPVRPPGLPADGVHEPGEPVRERRSVAAAEPTPRKPNQ